MNDAVTPPDDADSHTDASKITSDDARYNGTERVGLHVVAVVLRADGSEQTRFEWETWGWQNYSHEPWPLHALAASNLKPCEGNTPIKSPFKPKFHAVLMPVE